MLIKCSQNNTSLLHSYIPTSSYSKYSSLCIHTWKKKDKDKKCYDKIEKIEIVKWNKEKSLRTLGIDKIK